MIEKLPHESPEVNDSEHEQITILLEALDCIPPIPDEDAYFVFDKQDYATMSEDFGYDAVMVGVLADGRIAINIAHSPSHNQKQLDVYVYNPDERSLALQTTIKTHGPTIERAHKKYAKFESQSQSITDEIQKTYSLITQALRNTGDFSTFFRAYDKQNATFADKRLAMDTQQEVNDEMRYFLDVEELESEARLVMDIFDAAANRDVNFAKVVSQYREALYQDQLTKGKILQAKEWITQRENAQVSPVRTGNPTELIYVLDMLNVLTQDSAVDE